MAVRILIALTLGAFVLINQSAVHLRENVADSHLFAFYGWSLLHGAAPYLDVWDNKPPLIWWANAAAYALTDNHAVVDLLVGGGALLATLLAFVHAGGALYGPSMRWVAAAVGAVLLTQIRFEAGANRTESLTIALESLACALLLHPRGGGLAFLAGIAAGAAPWAKQNGGAFLLAAGVALAIRAATRTAPAAGPRPWHFLAGACTVQAGFVLALATTGSLADAWFAIVTFNRTHLSATAGATPAAEVATAASILAPLAGVAAFAAVGALLPRVDSWRRLLLTAWLLAELVVVPLGLARQPYTLAPALAPLGLLALGAVGGLLRDDGLSAACARRSFVAVMLVALLAPLAPLAAANVQQARVLWKQKPHWLALRRSSPAAYERQGEAIARLSRPNERIYVWGWSPGTYRFADRRSVSRFATLEKAGHSASAAALVVPSAIRDILAHPPTVFVISTADWSGLGPTQPAFAAWLAAHYREQAEVEGMHLLVRMD